MSGAIPLLSLCALLAWTDGCISLTKRGKCKVVAEHGVEAYGNGGIAPLIYISSTGIEWLNSSLGNLIPSNSR
jgi:hypothetical protein